MARLRTAKADLWFIVLFSTSENLSDPNRHPFAYGLQRLLQVGEQVVYTFDAHRQAHHLLGDSHLGALLGGDHGMRSEHRDGDQRLDSSQAGGEREQAHDLRSEEHTSELQSHSFISYAV